MVRCDTLSQTMTAIESSETDRPRESNQTECNRESIGADHHREFDEAAASGRQRPRRFSSLLKALTRTSYKQENNELRKEDHAQPTSRHQNYGNKGDEVSEHQIPVSNHEHDTVQMRRELEQQNQQLIAEKLQCEEMLAAERTKHEHYVKEASSKYDRKRRHYKELESEADDLENQVSHYCKHLHTAESKIKSLEERDRQATARINGYVETVEILRRKAEMVDEMKETISKLQPSNSDKISDADIAKKWQFLVQAVDKWVRNYLRKAKPRVETLQNDLRFVLSPSGIQQLTVHKALAIQAAILGVLAHNVFRPLLFGFTGIHADALEEFYDLIRRNDAEAAGTWRINTVTQCLLLSSFRDSQQDSVHQLAASLANTLVSLRPEASTDEGSSAFEKSLVEIVQTAVSLHWNLRRQLPQYYTLVPESGTRFAPDYMIAHKDGGEYPNEGVLDSPTANVPTTLLVECVFSPALIKADYGPDGDVVIAKAKVACRMEVRAVESATAQLVDVGA